jgi:hypothetical protein
VQTLAKARGRWGHAQAWDSHAITAQQKSIIRGTEARDEVSDALCAKGVETVSAELTLAMKQAHARSGKYAQDKMKDVYVELGLAPGMAGQ